MASRGGALKKAGQSAMGDIPGADLIGTARSEFNEIHRRMKNTRAERVALSKDSQILANRIKILKLEEQRARVQAIRENLPEFEYGRDDD